VKRALSAAVLLMTALAACQQQSGDGVFVPIEVPPLRFALSEHFPARAQPGDMALGDTRLLVTNSLEDTVSLFDLATMGTPSFTEVARIPVGLQPVELEGPHHAAIDPAGEFYYLAISNNVTGAGSGPHGAHGTGTADGYVLKYRTRDNELEAFVRVDRSPGDLVVSGDGRTLYVTHFDLLRVTEAVSGMRPAEEIDARLLIIDTQTMTRKPGIVLCPAPHGLRLSPDEKALYVACYSDELAIVDLTPSLPVVTRVKVAPNAGSGGNPIHEPYAVTVSPTSGDVWISSLRSGNVQLYDAAAKAIVPARNVFVGGAPVFGSFTADGRLLYMPTQQLDVIAVIRAADSEVLKTIALRPHGCLNVHEVRLVDSDRRALVVCEGNHRDPGTLLVLDLRPDGTAALLNKATVGIFPDYVGVVRRTR